MALLTKIAILSADDLHKELVEVPEWGGEVYIRTMTGTERDAFEVALLADGQTGAANVRAKLLARCLCDADGGRLFDDRDIAALGKKSASALDRCFSVAQRLNGFTKGDVEELAGN